MSKTRKMVLLPFYFSFSPLPQIIAFGYKRNGYCSSDLADSVWICDKTVFNDGWFPVQLLGNTALIDNKGQRRKSALPPDHGYDICRMVVFSGYRLTDPDGLYHTSSALNYQAAEYGVYQYRPPMLSAGKLIYPVLSSSIWIAPSPLHQREMPICCGP